MRDLGKNKKERQSPVEKTELKQITEHQDN